VELMLRFYAMPSWELGEKPKNAPPPERLEPKLPDGAQLTDALARSEFRDQKPWLRAVSLLDGKKDSQVFARPPADLPALLRLADQLLTLARQEAGEQAKVWRCACGARYAVPVALIRPGSIRCERCGRTVDLEPGKSLDDGAAADPSKFQINQSRVALADFFREAMARGWVVMVEPVA
jgi:hypothetical protein